MPVINFSYSDLCDLVGSEVPKDVLRTRLPMIGADLKSVEDSSDEVSFEFFPDRPDLFSVEGIARALRAFLEIEPGLRSYATESSGIELMVDPSVQRVRPFICSSLVVGNEIDDALIRSMMDLQEKLHVTLGRNRKKVAIGIHDSAAVKPPFTYKAVRPDEMSFVPLQGDRSMNLAQILADHDKGRAYAHILLDKDRYPVIVDVDGEVLSFPPVINGIRTAVTEDTRDIFVDCTGTDMNAVSTAVNIVTTALAERGGKVRTVKMVGPEGSVDSPDLDPRAVELDVSYVNKWVGTDLNSSDMARCLMRMGHGARVTETGIRAMVPAYRSDVIHPVDLAEDVAIGHGFEKFGGKLPRRSTFGTEDPVIAFSTRLRPVLTGLGYLEVVTLSLSSPEEQYDALGLERDGDAVIVSNPVSEDHRILRSSVLPGLFSILRKNKHRELPQRIFEVGEVVIRGMNATRVAGAAIHPKAGFTGVKSDVQSLMAALGRPCEVSKSEHGAFIPGRCALVVTGGQAVGVFGEISPSTLGAFGLGHPGVAFELDVDRLLRARSGLTGC